MTKPASIDVQLDIDPRTVFASQVRASWCAPAGTQITLAALGLADNSEQMQRRIARRIDEWSTWADSHDGGWGPAAIGKALAAYGAEYKLRAYDSRPEALREAALALTRTGSPVVILAWRGAHTWVMTGYRATGDLLDSPDAVVAGTYIYDPLWPRVSSIWGDTDPPGTFQDEAEMEYNFQAWQRPEGIYADRDGKFIILVPTGSVSGG